MPVTVQTVIYSLPKFQVDQMKQPPPPKQPPQPITNSTKIKNINQPLVEKKVLMPSASPCKPSAI